MDTQRSIIQFRDVCGKPCSDLKILRDYLTLLNKSNREKWTKNGIKTHIKHYLRWKYKDWSERFDDFKDIKSEGGFNGKKLNEGTLITKEEIEKIMKAEAKLFWKAFFISLYESGLRPIELRNLKWKDIKFNVDGDISELNIYATKTAKARSVFVKEATFYLKRLKEETKSKTPLVFSSPYNENQPISKGSVSIWLTKLSKKAIDREIYPYILRHSRATELYKSMPSKVAQKFMGHSKDMTDTYSHFSSDDIKEALGKTVYKLEEIPPEKKLKIDEDLEEIWKAIGKINKKLSKMK